MYHVFDVVKDLKDLSKKIGIKADGLIKKVIYDKKRESVSFVLENFTGDANVLRKVLEEYIGTHVDLVFEDIATFQVAEPENVENLQRFVMKQLNGSGEYIEKIEIEGKKLKIYALGEFGKNQIASRLKKIKNTLPFEEYTIETVHIDNLENEEEGLKSIPTSIKTTTTKPIKESKVNADIDKTQSSQSSRRCRVLCINTWFDAFTFQYASC